MNIKKYHSDSDSYNTQINNKNLTKKKNIFSKSKPYWNNLKHCTGICSQYDSSLKYCLPYYINLFRSFINSILILNIKTFIYDNYFQSRKVL